MPQCAEWIHIPNDAISALAVTDADSPKIAIYDAQGVSTPLHVLEKLHTKPVSVIKYNVRFEVVVSVDRAGMLEYWTGPKNDYKFPSKIVSFESKLDTSKISTRSAVYFPFALMKSFLPSDLYEFAKNKTIVTGMAFSNDGRRIATLSTDRKVRIFTFLTGKLIRVFDETLARFQEMQQTKHALPNMEFGRRYFPLDGNLLIF